MLHTSALIHLRSEESPRRSGLGSGLAFKADSISTTSFEAKCVSIILPRSKRPSAGGRTGRGLGGRGHSSPSSRRMAFRRGRVVQNSVRVGGREGMGGGLLLPGAGERCKIMHRVEPLSIANNYSYTPRTDRLQIDH